MPKIYAATLPVPPGHNQQYRSGKARGGKSVIYKTDAAKSWEEHVALLLRVNGWRELGPGNYSLGVHFVLHSSAHDIDSPIKTVLDAIQRALGVDDRYVDELSVSKVRCRPKERSLELIVRVK